MNNIRVLLEYKNKTETLEQKKDIKRSPQSPVCLQLQTFPLESCDSEVSLTLFALQINMLCLIVGATLNNDPIRLFLIIASRPLVFYCLFLDDTVICITNVMFGGVNLISNNSA